MEAPSSRIRFLLVSVIITCCFVQHSTGMHTIKGGGPPIASPRSSKSGKPAGSANSRAAGTGGEVAFAKSASASASLRLSSGRTSKDKVSSIAQLKTPFMGDTSPLEHQRRWAAPLPKIADSRIVVKATPATKRHADIKFKVGKFLEVDGGIVFGPAMFSISQQQQQQQQSLENDGGGGAVKHAKQISVMVPNLNALVRWRFLNGDEKVVVASGGYVATLERFETLQGSVIIGDDHQISNCSFVVPMRVFRVSFHEPDSFAADLHSRLEGHLERWVSESVERVLCAGVTVMENGGELMELIEELEAEGFLTEIRIRGERDDDDDDFANWLANWW